MSNTLIIYISLITPLILLLFILKKGIREVFIFYILGATICLMCSEIDGFILKYFNIAQYNLTINVTPFVEELMKSLPLLYYVFILRPKESSIFKAGICIGVGFAVLETSVACVNSIEVASILWALLRGLGAGLLHSLCGLGVAVGLYNMKNLKTAFIPILIGTYAIVILFHSTYNVLVQSNSSFYGLVLTLFVYLVILLISILYKKTGKEFIHD